MYLRGEWLVANGEWRVMSGVKLHFHIRTGFDFAQPKRVRSAILNFLGYQGIRHSPLATFWVGLAWLRLRSATGAPYSPLLTRHSSLVTPHKPSLFQLTKRSALL